MGKIFEVRFETAKLGDQEAKTTGEVETKSCSTQRSELVPLECGCHKLHE